MNIQHFLKSLFKIDDNTSASIITTLTVFILGYLVASLIKNIGNYFGRQANRQLFLKCLSTVNDSIKKRQEVLKIQLEEIDIKKLKAVPMAKIQFFQIGILTSMGYKDSFQCFFAGFENIFRCRANKKLRNKAFVKVWENMANIEFWENNMYEQIDPAQAEMNRITELMAKPLEEMRIFYTDLFNKVNDSGISNAERVFIAQLQAVVDSWAKQPNNRNAYVVNEYLSKEIKLLCDKHCTLRFAIDLRHKAMAASHWYENLEIVIVNLHRSLTEYGHSLRYFSRSTKKIIKILG